MSDTPRTDACVDSQGLYLLCCKLERELAEARKDVERLLRIEHFAWHLLDNLEHREQDEFVVMREDFEALARLFPDGYEAPCAGPRSS